MNSSTMTSTASANTAEAAETHQSQAAPTHADRVVWLMFAVTVVTCAAFIAIIVAHIF